MYYTCIAIISSVRSASASAKRVASRPRRGGRLLSILEPRFLSWPGPCPSSHFKAAELPRSKATPERIDPWRILAGQMLVEALLHLSRWTEGARTNKRTGGFGHDARPCSSCRWPEGVQNE